MNEYDPERLVERINELVREYQGPIKIKAESDPSSFSGFEEYKLSFKFTLELDGYKVNYELDKQNGNLWCNLIARTITYQHETDERFVIEGEHKLEFRSSFSWMHIDGICYDKNNVKVNILKERWSQKVKNYLQQEIPEIMDLVSQRPAPRTEGLDALLEELGE